MRRYWAAPALLLLSAAMLLPATAWSGGTLATADERLSEEECAPGSRASFVGFDAEVTALGCLDGPARRYLAAIDGGRVDRYVCFYLVPEGYENGGPCLDVSPGAERRQTSPLTGQRAPMVLGVGRVPGEGPVHVWGVTSPATASIGVEPAGSEEPVAAAMLPTEVLGAADQELPFAVFVAELPDTVDLCAPVIVRARDGGGDALGSDVVSPDDRAFPSPPLALPGSQDCRAQMMSELAAAVRSLAFSLVLG